MDALALHKRWQRVAPCLGNAVVAYQRIGHDQHLPRITGVGKRFRITRHGGVEDHLTDSARFVSERAPVELASVIKN